LIDSYTSGDGSGLALSTNTGTLTVLQGAANILALTLNPILESLAFAPIADSTNATLTTTLPLVLQAQDSSGATIIGPGNFVTSANAPNPITLSSSSSTHVVLQTTSGSPATAAVNATTDNNLGRISYDGTLFAGSQTVSASATGVPTVTFTLTLTLATGGLSVPASIAMGTDLSTSTALLPLSEPGFGGTFTLTSSSCAGIVTFPGTAGLGPSQSPTVTQVGGGTCTILVSDGLGHSGSVTVYSTTIGFTLQQHQRR